MREPMSNERRQQLKVAAKQRWAEMDPVEQERHRERGRAAGKKYWEKMDPEQRERKLQQLSIDGKQRWESMSEEKRERFLQHGRDAYYAKNPERREPHERVVKMLRTGELVKGACDCGETEHISWVWDYTDTPTLVGWRCQSCWKNR